MQTNVKAPSSVSIGATTPVASVGRVFVTGVVAAIIAIVVNVIIGQAALLLGAAKLPMLTPPPIVVFTLVGLVGATIVFLLLRRFTKNPVRIFQIVAAVMLVLSFIPDFLLLGSTATGSLWLTVGALLLMHIVAAAVVVWALTVYKAARAA